MRPICGAGHLWNRRHGSGLRKSIAHSSFFLFLFCLVLCGGVCVFSGWWGVCFFCGGGGVGDFFVFCWGVGGGGGGAPPHPD